MEDQIEGEFKDKRSNSFIDYGEQQGTLVFW